MNIALRTTTMLTAIAAAKDEQEHVELVYMPEKEGDTGVGVIQCRTKTEIQAGALRLYPHEGKFVHFKDSAERSKMEEKYNVRSCYVKALLVSASVGNSHNRAATEYFMILFETPHPPGSRIPADPLFQ